MAFAKEITLEAKLSEDIKEFFDLYDIKELVNKDEISEGLHVAIQHSKNYRDIHTELRLGLKEGYNDTYAGHEEVVRKLQEYPKKARRRLRDAMEYLEASKREEERLEKLAEREEKKVYLQCEYEFFLAKLGRKFTACNWELDNDYNDLSSSVNVFETSLDEWYSLNGRLKGMFGEDFEDKFAKKFAEITKSTSNKIKAGKVRLKEILQVHEDNTRNTEADRARVEQDKRLLDDQRAQEEREKLNDERKILAKTMFDHSH